MKYNLLSIVTSTAKTGTTHFLKKVSSFLSAMINPISFFGFVAQTVRTQYERLTHPDARKPEAVKTETVAILIEGNLDGLNKKELTAKIAVQRGVHSNNVQIHAQHKIDASQHNTPEERQEFAKNCLQQFNLAQEFAKKTAGSIASSTQSTSDSIEKPIIGIATTAQEATR